MTTEEALATVKKAVSCSDDILQDMVTLRQLGYVGPAARLKIILAALRAIGFDGPLKVIRKDITLEMIEAGRIEAANSGGKVTKIFRAMLAASEKQP